MYSLSKDIPKDYNKIVNRHKSLSVGYTNSYGNITSLYCSASLGGEGSPCINELGQCWGMLIGSYFDTPNLQDSEDEIDSDSSEENDNGVKKIIRI